MLAGTKPRSPTPRPSRTPQPPPISYSLIASRPSSQATVTSAPLSPPITPSRTRRPSISNTMHWLSRNSSQQSSSSPYTPAKPTRISEPKLIRSIELLSQPRSGVLGSGATVVRTPDDALRETGVRLTFDGKSEQTRSPNPVVEADFRKSASSEQELSGASLSSPASSAPEELVPDSPPLPPLPMPNVEETDYLATPNQPPRPTRAPPSAPPDTVRPASLRSSLKAKPIQQVEEINRVPPLPAHLSAAPAPGPFRPVLMSDVPTGPVDPSKIIVTLETSTVSHKTTLETLKSRPSHLSDYVHFLFRPQRASVASSVYSNASDDDVSAYRHHLTSQGLLPQSSFSVHLFLDRPSTPYPHILNYLRSPLGSSDAPETLPRSVQMLSSHQRLENLLELRDEAAYLGLEALRKLCMDEIRLRHGPRLHTRGHSTNTSAHSLQASVYSLHALLDRVESDILSGPRDSRSSGWKSSAKDIETETVARSPPTPESWNGSSSGQSEGRNSLVQSPPPAGWF